MRTFLALVLLAASVHAAPKSWDEMNPLQRLVYNRAAAKVERGQAVYVSTGGDTSRLPEKLEVFEVRDGVPGLLDGKVYRCWRDENGNDQCKVVEPEEIRVLDRWLPQLLPCRT